VALFGGDSREAHILLLFLLLLLLLLLLLADNMRWKFSVECG
jgi:hypothetical protein